MGNYCPEGSDAMQPCTAGMYCDADGLDAPTGFCDPGWYCPTGSDSVRQIICPRGYFCENVSAKSKMKYAQLISFNYVFICKWHC